VHAYSALNALDPKSYSVVKERRRYAGPQVRGSPTPACFGPGALEGRAFNTLARFGLAHENLVELIGIEPTTSGLQSPRSPS
jgi:hypothetical protein